MRILVISQPVWSDENNGGNTMSNLFSGFDAEFANIYFADGMPHNSICTRYYQISDHMVINHLLKHRKIGHSFEQEKSEAAAESSGFEKKYKSYSNFYTTLLRELAWKAVRVCTPELYRWIDAFEPDVIYAPCYGKGWVLRAVHEIAVHTGLPVVSYISDDLYYPTTNDNTPLKKWYRKKLQKSLKRYFGDIDRFYTMTDEQREAYEPLYGGTMHLLRKSSVVPYVKHEQQKPMKLLYAGGIYYGRSDVLCALAGIIRKLNENGKRFELHIYSGGELKEEENVLLNDGVHSYFHGSVTYRELLEIYHDCDIALHVESFEQSNSDITRLSFSTKILDCLQSGAPVLVIAPEENAGAAYLKRENGAYCINDLKDIEPGLEELEQQYGVWQKNAEVCLHRNHDREVNRTRLQNDFEDVIKQKRK